jgi:hypothetical protein
MMIVVTRLLALLSVAVLLGACSTTPKAQARTEGMMSVNSLRYHLSTAVPNVDRVLNAANVLGTNTGDNAAQLAEFTEAFDMMRKHARLVGDANRQMQTNGDAFFKAWDKELAGSFGDSADASARLGSARLRYGQIKQYMSTLETQYGRMKGHFDNILTKARAGLGDNPAAVLSPDIERAIKEKLDVTNTVDALLAELNEISRLPAR